jgi:hypothetical protein
VIERIYEDMNNPMGVANTRAAIALAIAAGGDLSAARDRLALALDHYLLGGREDPSGEAMVRRREQIIDVWRVT